MWQYSSWASPALVKNSLVSPWRTLEPTNRYSVLPARLRSSELTPTAPCAAPSLTSATMRSYALCRPSWMICVISGISPPMTPRTPEVSPPMKPIERTLLPTTMPTGS